MNKILSAFLIILFTVSFLGNAFAESNDMLNFSEKPSSDPSSKTPVYTPYDRLFKNNLNYNGPPPTTQLPNCNDPRFNSLQRKLCQQLVNRYNAEQAARGQYAQQHPLPAPPAQKPPLCTSREYFTLLIYGGVGDGCGRSGMNLSVFGVNNDACKWTDKDYSRLRDIYVACDGNIVSDQPLPAHVKQSIQQSADKAVFDLKTKVNAFKQTQTATSDSQPSDKQLLNDANAEYANLMASSSMFRECESRLTLAWKSLPDAKRKELKNEQNVWLRQRYMEVKSKYDVLSVPKDQSYCGINESRIAYFEKIFPPVRAQNDQPPARPQQDATPPAAQASVNASPAPAVPAKVSISVEPDATLSMKPSQSNPAQKRDSFSYD